MQNYNAKLSDFGLAKNGPTGDKSHISTRVMGTYGYAAPEYLATGMVYRLISCLFKFRPVFVHFRVVPIYVYISAYNWQFSFGFSVKEATLNMLYSYPIFVCLHKYFVCILIGIGHLSAKSDVYSFGVVLLEMLSGRRVIDYNRPCGEHNLVEWAKPYLANKRKVSRVLDNRLEGQYTLEVSQKVANLALQCLSKDPRFRPTMDDVVKELEQLKESKDMTTLVNKHNGSRHRRRSDGAVKELAALEESEDTTTLGSRHRRRSDGDAINRDATTVDCLSKTINIPSVCQINEGCF